MRAGFAIILAVLVPSFVLTGAADAQAEVRRAAVHVEGKHAKNLRKEIEGVLKQKKYKLWSGYKGAGDDAEALVDLARDKELTTFIDGTTSRKRKRWQVAVVVRDAASGEVVAEHTFSDTTVARLRRKVKRSLWKELGKAIGKTSAPAPVEEEVVEEALVAAAETPAEEPRVAATDAGSDTATTELRASGRGEKTSDGSLRAAVGVRLFTRSLAYNDDLFESLRHYRVPMVAAPAVRVAWYPRAAWGVEASAAMSVPFESESFEGERYPTRMSEYLIGLRYRRQLARAQVRVELDVGAHDFVIEASEEMRPPLIPDVGYRFARGGLAASVPLGDKLQLGAAAGYRYLLATGEITGPDYFPRGSAAGIDATASLWYPLTRTLHVQVAGELERYFYAMNPEPGDANVAGGAVDQSLGTRIELGLAF